MTGKFAVIVILIALGYLLKRINILKEEYNRLLLMVNDGKDFLSR